jgi:Ca2+-binding EF-hand superfamily protein
MNENSFKDIFYSNHLTADEKAKQIFPIFDKDKSGKINIVEFIALCKVGILLKYYLCLNNSTYF